MVSIPSGPPAAAAWPVAADAAYAAAASSVFAR
jgi:hypothetical protein